MVTVKAVRQYLPDDKCVALQNFALKNISKVQDRAVDFNVKKQNPLRLFQTSHCQTY